MMFMNYFNVGLAIAGVCVSILNKNYVATAWAVVAFLHAAHIVVLKSELEE